jgi:hypothetical protein
MEGAVGRGALTMNLIAGVPVSIAKKKPAKKRAAVRRKRISNQ